MIKADSPFLINPVISDNSLLVGKLRPRICLKALSKSTILYSGKFSSLASFRQYVINNSLWKLLANCLWITLFGIESSYNIIDRAWDMFNVW